MTIPVAPQEMSPTDPKKISGVWSFIHRFNAAVAWIRSLSPSGATLYDTGWVNLTLNGGFSGLTQPQYRRIGQMVYLRGAISGTLTGSTSGTLVATIPFAPSSYIRAVGAASTGEVSRRINIDLSGNLYLNAGSSSNVTWQSLDSVSPYTTA